VSARVLALLGALAAAAPALAQERPPALREVGFDQRLTSACLATSRCATRTAAR
jgi:hypothetical protein